MDHGSRFALARRTAAVVAACLALAVLVSASAARAQGTAYLVRDVDERPAGTAVAVRSIVAVGERVFFAGNDGVHGFELWTSDGSEEGTRLVEDIRPGPAGDVITEFLASGQGLPIGRFLLEADHAWVEAFTFGFDGANFPISTQVGEPFELRARIVGPDGELARCSATQIPPLAALTMIAKPTSPIDILQFHLPPGECLRAEFILTGKNPRVNFPVAVGITMKVELHTRGFIDVSAFGLP
ncbi:MAG TPA: hypothetical protein PKL84_16035 [Candidatus Hydrogenedentes bacterium]|nr:hypothetical protein [Candidatus Hydrogenedentota bacterium]